MGIRNTSSLPSRIGSLWLGVVVPFRVPCMDQIGLVSGLWHSTAFDHEVLIPELREMRNTSSLPSRIGSLWLGVVVPVRLPCMDQIGLVSGVWHLIEFNHEVLIPELREMRNTPSLTLLPVSPWSRIMVSIEVLSRNHLLRFKPYMLNWITSIK